MIPGNFVFGKQIKKRASDWLHYFGCHLDTIEDIWERAEQVLNKIFESAPPAPFSDLLHTPIAILEAETEPLPLQSIAGWFVGVRNGSQAHRVLLNTYLSIGKEVVSDEGFYALMLHLNPHINIYEVFHPCTSSYPIYEFALSNIFETVECGAINVGAQEISNAENITILTELKQLF